MMENNIRPPEQELYQKLYSFPQYKETSPGEAVVDDFLNAVLPKPGSTILDIGCGTGRAGVALSERGNLNVIMLDFVDNSLLPEIVQKVKNQQLQFIQTDITKKFPISAQYGFCTDVMEHIPTDLVDTVIDNCLTACEFIFFQIADFQETHGLKYVGHELHLTIKPYDWWLNKLINDHHCVMYASRQLTLVNNKGQILKGGGMYNYFVGSTKFQQTQKDNNETNHS